MSPRKIFLGCPIFDGDQIHHDHGLVVINGIVEAIIPRSQFTDADSPETLNDGMIVPGYVDLQVNGGGGVQFNETPSIDAIKRICETHLALGTTSVLVTLITATPDTTTSAIDAAIEAQSIEIPAFLGLHLEGPHLAELRKGAHRRDLIRPMEPDDLARLLEAKKHLANLKVTLAPEAVSNSQIKALSDAGIVVSIGHSDSTFEQVNAAAQAGARCVTHLFNAMSPLAHREPGVVGAALANGHLHAGLIADGHHVHFQAIRVALEAKKGPAGIFLVSDAMAPIGTKQTSFMLDGRKINRSNGCLTLEDGTLAGADIDMATAVKSLHSANIASIETTLKMATSYPANLFGKDRNFGKLLPGSTANFLKLDGELNVQNIWYRGDPIAHLKT